MFLFLALTLFDQSAARLLESRFTGLSLSYSVMDAESGKPIAERWPSPETAVPMGSLVKAFLVHRIAPTTRFRCDPLHCWHPAGHGEMGLTEALANSCNSYFLQAARLLDPTVSPQAAIGLGDNGKLTPREMLSAYRALLRRPDAGALRSGMHMAASSGTGKLAQVDAWVKTGTARCSHLRKSSGDGFVLVADKRMLVLVRVHGTTGAEAARVAGEMWRAVH